MTLSNGVLSAATLEIGSGKNSQGTLTIVGGSAAVTSSMVIGISNRAALVSVSSGSLSVTNQSGTAQLVFGLEGRGTFAEAGGIVTVDQLAVVNGSNSIFTLSAGVFSARSATVSNSFPVVIGDGVRSASYRLLGGIHTFVDGLRVRTNSSLTGCGTINGDVVINPGATVMADCGGTMNFTGIFTNNGAINAINGTSVNFFGPVLNNGTIDATNGSVRFWSTIQDNGTMQLDPNSDSDGDGIPNAWTQQHFGHPTGQLSDNSCATCDAFGTGQDNLFKYVAGLDPTNPASVFVLKIADAISQPTLLFDPVVAGRTYTPEFSTDLTLVGWSPLTGYVGPATNGSQVTITDTNAVEPQKFYRIRISLP